jgi:hypothetical protein
MAGEQASLDSVSYKVMGEYRALTEHNLDAYNSLK